MKWLYFVLIFAAIVIVVLIGFTLIINEPRVPDAQKPKITTPKKLTADPTDPFIGSADAPITIITAGSFACAACKDQAPVLNTVLAFYPGKVKIVWKDLPDTVGDSYVAALAARCAQVQGKFWPYHDLLMQFQSLLSERKYYTVWAQQLGLRIAEFDACLDKQEQKDRVDANIIEGLQAKIEHIPALQINDGEIVQDIQNIGYFQSVINDLLSKQNVQQ